MFLPEADRLKRTDNDVLDLFYQLRGLRGRKRWLGLVFFQLCSFLAPRWRQLLRPIKSKSRFPPSPPEFLSWTFSFSDFDAGRCMKRAHGSHPTAGKSTSGLGVLLIFSRARVWPTPIAIMAHGPRIALPMPVLIVVGSYFVCWYGSRIAIYFCSAARNAGKSGCPRRSRSTVRVGGSRMAINCAASRRLAALRPAAKGIISELPSALQQVIACGRRRDL